MPSQMIRSLASLLLSLVVAQAQGLDRWFGSRKMWPFLAARGFTGAASMTLYYEGIARMPLADAVGFHGPPSYTLRRLIWDCLGMPNKSQSISLMPHPGA